MTDVKVWIQIFFSDGSVSQGKRVPADILDEENHRILRNEIDKLLDSVNRNTGHVVIWGAGNLLSFNYASSSGELNSLVLEKSFVLRLLQKIQKRLSFWQA